MPRLKEKISLGEDKSISTARLPETFSFSALRSTAVSYLVALTSINSFSVGRLALF